LLPGDIEAHAIAIDLKTKGPVAPNH
jgi:hypothetical protein